MQTEHLSPSPLGFPFRKDQRLLNPSDFKPVFANAPFRASHPNLLILSRPNSLGQARLGLIIAKKHVRKAHERNRIKRMSRESFRLLQHKFPPIDAIVLARRGADTLSPAEFNAILNGLWKRIIKRAQRELAN